MATTTLVMKRAAACAAIAAAGALALPALASAAPDPSRVTFAATDNGDCTATFEIVNTTSSDMNKVVYWTGEDRPTEAPAFGKDEGSELALTSKVEEGKPNWTVDKKYARGYAPTTAPANIEFTSVAGDGDTVEVAGDGDTVEVAYRMTGLERDDYDNALKNVTVTGCAAPTSNGSLGSLFGS